MPVPRSLYFDPEIYSTLLHAHGEIVAFMRRHHRPLPDDCHGALVDRMHVGRPVVVPGTAVDLDGEEWVCVEASGEMVAVDPVLSVGELVDWRRPGGELVGYTSEDSLPGGRR